MTRIAALLSVALLLLAPAAGSTAPGDYLIVPGQRIGKWTLQMTIADLVRVNGAADLIQTNSAGEEGNLDAPSNSYLYIWNSLGLGAQTVDKKTVIGLVAGVSLSPPPYQTAQGINLLANTRDDVVKAYGKPVVLKGASNPAFDLIYDKSGIAFRVMGGGEIRSIEIFRPGAAKSLWKF
jgi:hypothetical protein